MAAPSPGGAAGADAAMAAPSPGTPAGGCRPLAAGVAIATNCELTPQPLPPPNAMRYSMGTGGERAPHHHHPPALTMTTTCYATASDFYNWEDRAKGMTIEALVYTINDCHQAARAMRGWNPIKEGFYMDQANTYGMELNRRKAA